MQMNEKIINLQTFALMFKNINTKKLITIYEFCCR